MDGTKRQRSYRWLIAMALVALAWPAAHAAAAEACAQVVSIQGRVEIQRAGQSDWMPVQRLGTQVCEGDRLRTGALSRAALLVGPSALVRVEQNTAMGLRLSAEETQVELQSGAVYSISRFPRRYRINTPFVNAGVEGTEFLVALERDQAQVAVYEGRVTAEDLVGQRGERRTIASGEVARFARGTPPVVSLLINPTDAVQWALYYPPLEAQAIGESIYDLADCERTAVAERVRCLTRRAGKLLRLGRVERAERDIEDAGLEDAEALALSALIRVVKSDKVGALDLARRAVSRDARSVPALIALSYAEQAHFHLDEALAAATTATALEPANAVAHARRAELLLSVGRIDDAEAAASAAVQASPAERRARTVPGFSHLARLHTRRAREQLVEAATHDPSDPLPRLGLGLAAIKDGHLEEGRSEIEVAVALDPQNALLRSYLGKAYSDELRDALAATQLERAKALDSRDPTAWYYNAIRLQAINRPGEALEELQQSIERNENRAVYRSRLLLDQDQAARSASLARIYSDLGFDELALSAAKHAVIGDPGSPSAHRLLAEAYLPVPGFEIARVSEVLQSQLLQTANAAVLPPHLQQIRSPLLLGTGPLTPSFQEFNPLFARDRHAFSASGVAGSEKTWSDELVYGYYMGRRTFQLGQHHYETSGFRSNADLRQNSYRAFYQEDLSPNSSVQAELRHADRKAGDPRFQFDPGTFSPFQRSTFEATAFRLGARHSREPGSTLVASFIAERRNTDFIDTLLDPFVQIDFANRTRVQAYTMELQYQGRSRFADVIAGGGLYEHEETGTLASTLTFIGAPIPPMEQVLPLDAKLQSHNAYVYSYLGRPWRPKMVLGVSVDSVENSDPTGPGNETEINPKLGAVIPLATGTTFRLAAFRGMKRLPAVTPTIEPTHVAGFNQVFDDLNQTRFWRYGAAVEQRWSSRLHSGIELTRRKIDAPLGAGIEEDRDEWLHRAFTSYAATARIALGVEFLVERLARETIPPGSPFLLAAKIDTRSLPLSVAYHHPSGLFARSRLSLVRQTIDSRNDFGSEQAERDGFRVLDFSVGTRLPRRRGIVSVDIKNVLGESFRFRDTAFEGLPRVPLYAPERAVFARLQLNL